MQLVQINNSFETFTSTASGAIATHIWEVSKRSGVSPLVISQGSNEPALEGVEIEHIPAWPERTGGWRGWGRRLVRRLTGWREAEQRVHARHVVHVLRRRSLKRVCLMLHNDPELAVCLKSEFPNARVVHHFHNPIVAKEPFLSRFRKSVDAVTAVSLYVAGEVAKAYRTQSVSVVYNGVDLEKFKPVHSLPRPRPSINFLGRTGIEKAPDVLLMAALRLAQEGIPLRVQLIGSNHWGRWEADDYQTQLAVLCEKLLGAGAEVCTTGHLSREQVPVRLGDADIHVLPSRWEEPCALSLLEGMAAGLPVVASRTGGTPEVLGSAGLLFTKDSVEELSQHLRRLLLDAPFRVSLGADARRRAQLFTWERCWEGFHQILSRGETGGG